MQREQEQNLALERELIAKGEKITREREQKARDKRLAEPECF